MCSEALVQLATAFVR